jgi:hypothetical protein
VGVVPPPHAQPAAMCADQPRAPQLHACDRLQAGHCVRQAGTVTQAPHLHRSRRQPCVSSKQLSGSAGGDLGQRAGQQAPPMPSLTKCISPAAGWLAGWLPRTGPARNKPSLAGHTRAGHNPVRTSLCWQGAE